MENGETPIINKLTKETLVPLGVLTGAITLVVGISFWLATISSDVRTAQVVNAEQSAKIEAANEALNQIRITQIQSQQEVLSRLTRIETILSGLGPQ